MWPCLVLVGGRGEGPCALDQLVCHRLRNGASARGVPPPGCRRPRLGPAARAPQLQLAARSAMRRFRHFTIERMLDERLAVLAARHDRRLRAAGVTVRKTIDLVIGTFCIDRGHALLHDDRDFAPMAEHLGLRLA